MLLSLPPAYVDRDEPGRDQRMQTIADAVAHATARASCTGPYDEAGCEPIWQDSPTNLAALVVTKGWWESRFVRNVHEGKCRPDECDPIRTPQGIVHRARSPWQIQRTAYSERFWTSMVGTGFKPTRNAAWVAATILAEGKRRCRSYYGALAWYGVQRCDWSGAKRRFFTYTKLVEKASKQGQAEVASGHVIDKKQGPLASVASR